MTASSGVASTLSWRVSGGAGDHAGNEGAAHCQASLCHLSSTGTGSASPQGDRESHAAKLGLSFNTRRDMSILYLLILPARSTAENETGESRVAKEVVLGAFYSCPGYVSALSLLPRHKLHLSINITLASITVFSARRRGWVEHCLVSQRGTSSCLVWSVRE